jgi:hypothetical protein
LAKEFKADAGAQDAKSKDDSEVKAIIQELQGVLGKQEL